MPNSIHCLALICRREFKARMTPSPPFAFYSITAVTWIMQHLFSAISHRWQPGLVSWAPFFHSVKLGSWRRAARVQKHHEKINLWPVIDEKTMNNMRHTLLPPSPDLLFWGTGLRAPSAHVCQIVWCVISCVGTVSPSYITRMCVCSWVTHSNGSQRVWLNLHFHPRPAVKSWVLAKFSGTLSIIPTDAFFH